MREAAEHFWPWYSNDARTTAVDDLVGVGRRVGDDEVLAAGLADDARVAPVATRCSRRPSATCPGTPTWTL